MLNLLFISCNPKIGKLKNILQPQLKAKVDVVDDFDLGLKEVLEKRPAAVVIQDHICDVAGENVVRHIQMLLGKEAPKFILLHEGDVKADGKALFEQCIDLAHSEEQLAEEILSALKTILGEQWKKVFVLPKMDAETVAASVSVLSKEREVANKMVDDLISDMNGPEKLPEMAESEQVDKSEALVTSTTDEMAAMLIEATRRVDLSAIEPTSSPAKAPEVADVKMKDTGLTQARPASSGSPKQKPVTSTTSGSDPGGSNVTTSTAQPVQLKAPLIPAATASQGEKSSISSRPSSPNAPVSPANFNVSGKPTPVNDPIPEELLLAFEANYRSQSSLWRNTAMAVGAVCVLGAAGWFLLSTKPGNLKFIQKKVPQPVVTGVRPLQDKTAASPVAIPRADTAVSKPAPAGGAGLPSFVSQKTKDTTYTTRKPGWERFVDPSREVRIFRTGDRIKAVQIMAGKGKTIDKTFLESVLQELAGTNTYTLGQRERKQGYQGYLVQHGSVGNKAELIVYRKKTSDAIVAFVVSLD